MRRWLLPFAVLGALAATPASAQQSELELLKQQVQQLMDRIEELEASQAASQVEQARIQDQLQQTQTAAADQAGVVESGNDRVKLSLSGQVNRGLIYVDDGEQDGLLNVDNDNSSTRFRLIGTAQVADGLSVGTNIEVELESNSTASTNFDNKGGGFNFNERKLEAFVTSEDYGRLSLGQGDTASNGTSEVDLSGTTVIGYSSIADMAGGFFFRDEDGGNGPEIGDVFTNFDGLSRDDRVRYDTPPIAGFVASTSLISSTEYDAALRFASSFSGVKVAAAASYARRDVDGDSDDQDQISGSASVLVPVGDDPGVSVTVSAGTRTAGGSDDPTNIYGKLGYEFGNLFGGPDGGIGATAFAIDYERTEDLDQEGDVGESYGVFAVQDIDVASTEIYFGVRNHELDRDGTDFDDVLAVLAGARVRF